MFFAAKDDAERWFKARDEKAKAKREAIIAIGRSEGLREGKEAGRREGREKALREGRAEGINDGIRQGLTEGVREGFREGLREGRREERERNIKLMKRHGVQLPPEMLYDLLGDDDS